MKHTRIIVTHYGGPDALQVVEEECPEPKKGEVRVKVLAAGVSLPDIMAREGVHPETPRVPYTPGWDLVGVVDRLGDGISGVEPAQTVAALPIHGAYTEYICLPRDELVPVPPGLNPGTPTARSVKPSALKSPAVSASPKSCPRNGAAPTSVRRARRAVDRRVPRHGNHPPGGSRINR